MPTALPQLESHLIRAATTWREEGGEGTSGPAQFFAGYTPTHGDFNVFHHLDNAMLLEPDLLSTGSTPILDQWFDAMSVSDATTLTANIP